MKRYFLLPVILIILLMSFVSGINVYAYLDGNLPNVTQNCQYWVRFMYASDVESYVVFNSSEPTVWYDMPTHTIHFDNVGTPTYYHYNRTPTMQWTQELTYSSNGFSCISGTITSNITVKDNLGDVYYKPPSVELVYPQLNEVIHDYPEYLLYDCNFDVVDTYSLKFYQSESGNFRLYNILSFMPQNNPNESQIFTNDKMVFALGINKIEIYNVSDAKIEDSVTFEIDLPVTTVYQIQGFNDGDILQTPPTVFITKSNNQIVDLYHVSADNTQTKICTFENSAVNNREINLSSTICKVGKNTLELRDLSNNVLTSKSFFLEEGDDGVINENPDTVLKNYQDDYTGFDIFKPSTWFIPIRSAFLQIISPVTSVTVLFRQVTGWLPATWVTLTCFAIALGIFLRVLNR